MSSLTLEQYINKYGGSRGKFRPSLHSLVGKKKLVGAEIGVAKGDHAKEILNNLDIEKLYLIDLYQLYEGYTNKAANLEYRAHNNLKKWESKIEWIKEYSDTAAKRIEDEELDFAYIDANHERGYITKDLEVYYPKVKMNGILAGHDFQYNQVRRAVEEFFPKEKIWTTVCRLAHRDQRQLVWIDWWVFKTVDLHNKINEL